MKKKLFSISFFFLSFLFHLLGSDHQIIQVNELPTNGFKLHEVLQYYEEGESPLKDGDVATISDDHFEYLNPKVNDLRNKKIWWLKFRGYNSSESAVETLLFHDKAGYTKAYFIQNGKWQERNIGYLTSPKNRNGFLKNEYTTIVFPPKDTLEIYIRFVVTYDKEKVSLFELYPAKEGWERIAKSLDDKIPYFLYYGVFLGIIFIFILFAFLQYFQHRDKIYLFYSIYLLSVFINYVVRASRQFLTFFTPYNEKWVELLNTPFMFLNGLTYLLLFRSFLSEEIKEELQHRKVILGLFGLVLFFLVIDFILKYFEYYHFSTSLFKKELPILAIIFLYVVWSSFKLRFSAYHFFVTGSLVLVFFSIINILNDGWLNEVLGMKIIEDHFWRLPLSATQVGIIAEIIFFSLAVAYRTKMIVKERNEAREVIFLTKQENEILQEQLNQSISNLENVKEEVIDNKLTLPTRDGYEFVDKSLILYCKADGNYCRIITKDEKLFIVSKTLKEIQEILSDDSFFRIHNSYFINLNFVKKYKKGNAGYITLINNQELAVSRKKKEDLLLKLKLK